MLSLLNYLDEVPEEDWVVGHKRQRQVAHVARTEHGRQTARTTDIITLLGAWNSNRSNYSLYS